MTRRELLRAECDYWVSVLKDKSMSLSERCLAEARLLRSSNALFDCTASGTGDEEI